MNKVTKEINIYDSDCIGIDGKQYVSYSKLCEKRKAYNDEIILLDERIKELEEENTALKFLLKDKLKQELRQVE